MLIIPKFQNEALVWVLLKLPTTDPSTTNPPTHRPLTHRPTDHLSTDPPTDYHQNI